MAFAKVENNVIVEYPIYENDILLRFPNTSFTIPFFPPDGYLAVAESTPPSIDPNKETLVETQPEFIEGILTRQWAIKELELNAQNNRKEIRSIEIRNQRNLRLRGSDWTQLQDAPVDKEAWKEYRQKLRDLTLQEDFPFNVQWPSQP